MSVAGSGVLGAKFWEVIVYVHTQSLRQEWLRPSPIRKSEFGMEASGVGIKTRGSCLCGVSQLWGESILETFPVEVSARAAQVVVE